MERAYTVREIDALRQACRNKYIWGRYSGPICPPGESVAGRAHQESDMVAVSEELVRTYMLSGHTADDLIASETPTLPLPPLRDKAE